MRIDLVGEGWRELVGYFSKPWIACNRRAEEGGKWKGSGPERLAELLGAVRLGADIVDIELGTPLLDKMVGEIKGRAKCLLSYHDLKETPSAEKMRQIVHSQLAAGADICKVVTTARSFKENLAVLQLMSDFKESRVVAFAMGEAGVVSRILCPLVGGYFTYASIEEGRESAPGQLTVKDLRKIYGMLDNGK